jgi:lipopolysaccharide assembly protein B
MEFEFWWLLVLPLFFGLGWVAARIDVRHLIRASSRLPDSYFAGLNFLLNEQHDKAIEAFVDVVKLDAETVELHFALGNLFRRRGETNRAIRVHQNLVGRSDLEPSQREHALFELGQDYLRAGLLDRAEDVFHRLEGSSYGGDALRNRLSIAQLVHDWPLAIELAQRLQRESGVDQRQLIAHFHCELAQQALNGAVGAQLRNDEARRQIDAALEAAPGHPRPWLLLGEACYAEGGYAEALDAWRHVARISPAHLAVIGERWLHASERLGFTADGLALLEDVHRMHPSVDALRAIAGCRARRDGAAAAVDWLQAELERAPSLLGLEQLLELRKAAAADPAADPAAAGGPQTQTGEAELTATLIKRQAARLSRYVCADCGFKAKQFHWQCPGCNGWDSYPPKRTEELEAG